MKTVVILSFLMLMLTLGCASMAPTVPEAEKRAVVKANTAFAFDLYGQLRSRSGNLFLSPYSISTALAMTEAGARGQTAEEMNKVLHFPRNHASVHPAFAALNWEIAGGGKPRGYELYLANALWGQKGYHFLPDYLRLTKDSYGAGLRQVDFRNAAEDARRTINHWVENQTHDKISELLQPGVLDAYTRLVLTNAIYFKGDWAHPFQKERTQDADFRVTAERKTPVPLMHQTKEFPYFAGDGFQVLEMPYRGDAVSMVIFLPEKVDGLAAFEQSLTADKVAESLAKLRDQKVEVAFPKFRVTDEFQLKDALSALGMPTAFAQQADFSGMDGTEDLFLTAVVHKAFVDVNEQGTEAAAATGVVVGVKSALPTPIPVFRADHPFLFLIRDKRSDSLLFLGRVVDPTK